MGTDIIMGLRLYVAEYDFCYGLKQPVSRLYRLWQRQHCLRHDLIENSDRHYGNFGFIRDVDSLKFLGPAPLFDNGTSLWCESLNSEIGTALPAMPFKDSQKKQLALVKECFVDVNGIDACVEIVRNTLSTSPYLDKERVTRISEAVGNSARGLKNYLSKLN